MTEREQRLERGRGSGRRSRQLERLASTISEALTPEDVSRVVVAEAVMALDGDGGAVVMLDEARQTLSMSAGIGWPLEERASFRNIPLTLRSPTTDAVRTRRVVHVDDPRAQGQRYPSLADTRARHGVAASLALPLLSGPRCVGGLLVTFSSPRDRSSK